VTLLQKLAREEALGRYRLIARLGQGGMAEVFLARLVGAGGFEKLVAVKCMLPALSDDRRFVAMFLNEGRIAAQLDHPNVCHVYELDQAGGTLFLAMEFLRGLPWSEIVPAIPDQPRTTLVRFITGAIAQACEGLHHAHTVVGVDGQLRPIVHRDVSPTNLFVTSEGIVKLLDFGVSKVLTESAMTASGVLKGKLPYMSPEQLRNLPVDVRSDLFALAVVTWEALAGRALFDRESAYDTMVAVAEAEIPALPGDDPVTERLDAVLRRALARDRTHRHGSTREFADDLCRAIAAYGAPMIAIEIQAHISTWLGPSLLRRGRELAALLGGWKQLEELTDERTVPHEPAPVAGARLRDVSLAVDNTELDVTQAMAGTPADGSTDTITDLTPASTTEAPGVEMTAVTGELTMPRVATAVTVALPGYAMSEPTTTEPTWRRAAAPKEVTPTGRPEWVPTVVLAKPPRSLLRSLVLLVIAIVAMEAGVLVGRWLA
jgi:eukaryotic-like serine/threonine-protein kinase